MALVTYVTRVSLLILVGRVSLPKPMATALRYIPTGIITALVVPSVLVNNGVIHVSPWNPFITGAFVSAVVAARSKNALLAMCGGVTAVVVIRVLVGTA